VNSTSMWQDCSQWGVSFHETLLMALLLPGLPLSFEMFCSTVCHREKMPSLDQLFGMGKLEENNLLRKETGVRSTAYLSTTANTKGFRNKCDVLNF
jgi:hypothetical protein